MLNRDYIIVEIITALQKLIANQTSLAEQEQILHKIAKACEVQYEDIVNLYNKLSLFQLQIQQIGGKEAYEKSGFTWLKAELELLLYAYKFFQKNGVSVIVISDYLSKDNLHIFSKTKSQLQNTYYKVRNNQIPIENLTKQKPGRKPGQEYKKYTKKEVASTKETLSDVMMHIDKNSIQQTAVISEQVNKNLVQLLSGMIHNFQVICGHNTDNEQQLYQLVEGIYELSSMAAESTQINQNVRALEEELDFFHKQTRKLQKEKEGLIQNIHSIATHINAFVESSDMEQIKGLSKFVRICKHDLKKLDVYWANDSEVKMFTDRIEQAVSTK